MVSMESDNFEKLYSPSQWSKRYDAEQLLNKHNEFLNINSEKLRQSIPCQLDISYGPGAKDKYDIYGIDLPDGSPTFIHIHGGYYQEPMINHKNNGFIANIPYQRKHKTILLGYELSPERTLPEILKYIVKGITQCIEYAKQKKSSKIFLSGHSVGAHAIASVLSQLRTNLSQEDSELIKEVFLLCGIYNLEPITKMSANELLKLSVKQSRELSPVLHPVDYGNTKVHVVAAENDSPAFVQQSMEFYEKLIKDEVDADVMVVPEVDHFDIIENLYYKEFFSSIMKGAC